MMKLLGIFGSRKEQEIIAPPVIKRREEDLRPEIRYTLQPEHVYRKFPADAPESAVQEPCGKCGHSYDGPTQTHCPACDSDRKAYMLDVTNEPFHTLPPTTPDGQREIRADDMIPTFGGDVEVRIGDHSTAVKANGSLVVIGNESCVDYIAGNNVHIGEEVEFKVAASKGWLRIADRSSCEGDITGTHITIGDSCNIDQIVLPENGELEIGNNVTIRQICLGRGSKIRAFHNLNLEYLVILDVGCSVTLGTGCTIETFEAEVSFAFTENGRFSNSNHNDLEDNYNLPALISGIVRDALGKGY